LNQPRSGSIVATRRGEFSTLKAGVKLILILKAGYLNSLSPCGDY
jgi:hypothetical protein